jgi:hypothetical protein
VSEAMRKVAIGLNAILFSFVIYWLATDGIPSDAKGVLIFILLLLTPIVSVPALLSGTSESWLSLYLRRKSLEEKKKIENLSNSERKL